MLTKVSNQQEDDDEMEEEHLQKKEKNAPSKQGSCAANVSIP